MSDVFFRIAQEQTARMRNEMEPMGREFEDSMRAAYAEHGADPDTIMQTDLRERTYAQFAAEAISLLPKVTVTHHKTGPAGAKKWAIDTVQIDCDQDTTLPQKFNTSLAWWGMQPFYVFGRKYTDVQPSRFKFWKPAERQLTGVMYAPVCLPDDYTYPSIKIGRNMISNGAQQLPVAPGTLYISKEKGDTYQTTRTKLAEHQESIVTPEQLRSLFDKKVGKYVLNYGNFGEESRIIGEPLARDARITDKQIVRYNVFDNLAKLAILFNVGERYQDLFSKYRSIIAPNMPLDEAEDLTPTPTLESAYDSLVL